MSELRWLEYDMIFSVDGEVSTTKTNMKLQYRNKYSINNKAQYTDWVDVPTANEQKIKDE